MAPLGSGASSGANPAASFLIDHARPTAPGRGHSRPFDQFRLEGGLSSAGFDRVAARGVLAGRDYGRGVARGVLGIYGGYDYFAPDVFRVSSTSVSSGTSAAWRWPSMTLQATALVGVGYTATQPVHMAERRAAGYDVAPQALVGLQVASRFASLDLTARQYIIGEGAGFGARQREAIFRGDAALVLRLADRHGVTLTYARSQHTVSNATLPAVTAARSSVGVFYTVLTSRSGTTR
jgi:hypothetical protein